MHCVSHISESIRQMDSGDKFWTDICGWLHIDNLNQAYRSSNKVNYIHQMLKHNARCTGFDYMEETLSYLAFKGWYEIGSAKDFTRLSATNTWQIARRAHLL